MYFSLFLNYHSITISCMIFLISYLLFKNILRFDLMLVSTLSSSRPTESRCGAHCVADTVHYRCTVLKDEMISPSNRRFLHKVTNFYVDLCGSSGESAGRLEIAIISIYGAKWPERSSWHVQGMASECTRFQSGLHDEIKSEPCCQDIVWNLCAVQWIFTNSAYPFFLLRGIAFGIDAWMGRIWHDCDVLFLVLP